MARFIAFAVAALLVLSLAAETVSAQGKFCHTSAYKVDLNLATNNKMMMYKNCKADVKILSSTKVGDCAVIVQQTPNQAAWDTYSACEKSAQNNALYAPLKAGSDACKSQQKNAAC